MADEKHLALAVKGVIDGADSHPPTVLSMLGTVSEVQEKIARWLWNDASQAILAGGHTFDSFRALAADLMRALGVEGDERGPDR